MAMGFIYLIFLFTSWDSSLLNLFNGQYSSDNINRLTHWLIIDNQVELDQYLLNPVKNLTIAFDADRSYHSALEKNSINFVNIRTESNRTIFQTKDALLRLYLAAIQGGARIIGESQTNLSMIDNVQYVAFHRQRSLLVNIHPTFTGNFTFVTPGLPEKEILNITQDGWSSIRTIDNEIETIHPLIQQEIPLFENNRSLFIDHPPVAIEEMTFSPFSREKILFSYDAFWALVLPKSKSEF